MLFAGNRVVVRSTATGTPRGEFFGMEADGSRSFEIQTIDIHTVVDGRIVRSYHNEDWNRDMMQVFGEEQ